MTGKDFVALVRLSNKENVTVADVGETCERVLASSLPWLLEHGHIRAIDKPPSARPTRGGR